MEQKELNNRQRRLVDLLKDYDCVIDYHPGKATVVVDALSRKERLNELVEMRRMGTDLEVDLDKGLFTRVLVRPFLLDQNSWTMATYELVMEVQQLVLRQGYALHLEGRRDAFQERVYVPVGSKLREEILDEVHSSAYSMHQGDTKIYITL